MPLVKQLLETIEIPLQTGFGSIVTLIQHFFAFYILNRLIIYSSNFLF